MPCPALPAVTSLNVPQIAREVGTAVQRVVQEQSSGLRGALSARSSRALAQPGGEQPAEGAAPANQELAAEATALAARLGPAITGKLWCAAGRLHILLQQKW